MKTKRWLLGVLAILTLLVTLQYLSIGYCFSPLLIAGGGVPAQLLCLLVYLLAVVLVFFYFFSFAGVIIALMLFLHKKIKSLGKKGKVVVEKK